MITTAPTEAATLNIPKIFETGNTETLSIVLPETDQDITLVYGEQTESAPKNIDVKANSTGKLSIIAPESTVSVGGSFGELEVETADDTLIVGEDAEVTILTVKKGNVEIYGKVGSIAFAEGAGVVKVWVVRDTESLVTALEFARNGKNLKTIVSGVSLTENVDLGNTEVWFEGNVNLGGNTVNVGNENWINVEKDLTVTGGGTIDNTASNEPAKGHQKSLFHVMGGEFVLDGVTLINDMDYHWHGSVSDRPYNSSAVSYWNDTKIVIRNSRILSGEFTLCGMGRGGVNTADVYLVDSYFESTSTNKNNGVNWAYAMRVFGKKIVMENCEVKGIQGAVSIEECVDAEIRSGKYYTVNSAGANDAFYPLYVTGGATVKISGGEFSAAVNRSGAVVEGTSAVVCGDNDTGMAVGSVILTGGKFSGKAYNHVRKIVYEPLEGYVYKAIEGGETLGEQPLVWEVVPEEY